VKISLSTNWCNEKIESGEEIAELAASLGFDELELGFRTTEKQVEGFKRKIDLIPIGSIHAFCPVPMSAPRGSPELYSLASFSEDARAIARFHILKNARFAADIGADSIVLHAGTVKLNSFFRKSYCSSALEDILFKVDENSQDRQYRKILKKVRDRRSLVGKKMLEIFKKELSIISPKLERLGCCLAFENLPYIEGFPNEIEMEEIQKEFDPSVISAWFDTGHYAVRKWNDWLFGDLPEKVRGLHINDILKNKDDHLPPGKGNIDFSLFSEMFATAKHIVFEPKGNVSVEDLQQALKAWKVK
jgi:sugar phosphate isomerase/epimerase